MKGCLYITVAALLIISSTFRLLAAPFDTGMIELQQPDETTFIGRIWGDEFFYWAETEEGYRFVQSGDGWYYYAQLDENGEFTATEYKVGIDEPPSESYQLERTQARIDEINQMIEEFIEQVELNRQWYAEKQDEADRLGQPAVNLEIGIILIEFQDVKHFDPDQYPRIGGYLKSDFEDMMFSENGVWFDTTGTTPHPENEKIFGSFKDYWLQMSRGKLRVGGQVVNPVDENGVPEWLEANYNRQYYVDEYHVGYLASEAVQKALAAGYISNIPGHPKYYNNLAIIYAQYPIVGTHNTAGGWPDFNWYILGEQMGPIVYGQDKSFTHIGFHLNSFGVNLGFYDGGPQPGYNFPSNPTQTFNFDLMNRGWYNGPNSKGECPATLAPYLRLEKGWVEPIPITSDSNNFLVEYDYQNPKLYKIDPIEGPENMHYIFEVRKREGFDAYIPEPPETYQNQPGTLLIWQHNAEFWLDGQLMVDKIRLKQADYISSESTQLNDFFPSADWNNNQSLNDITLPAASVGNYYDEFDEDWIQPAHFAINGIQKLSDGNSTIDEIRLNHPLWIKNKNSGGWQAVSIPHGLTSYYLYNVFPTCTSAYKFVNGSYEPATTLENGSAYMVNFPNSPQTLSFSGSLIDFLEIPVSPMWNLKGSISYKLPRDCIYSDPPGIIGAIYEVANSGGYIFLEPYDYFKPGLAYWIQATNTGTIFFERHDEPCTQLKITSIPALNLLSMDKFIITDAEGISQNLYVSNIDIDTSIADLNLDLPPFFPEINFDSRFEYNEFVKKVSADSGTIDLNILVHTNSFPVNLAWEINPANGINYSFIGDTIIGKISKIETNSGEISFNKLVNNKIQLSVLVDKINSSYNLPKEFRLEQNYPNPFNPNTVIEFSVPKEVLVNISVFNLLGEKVKELKNEVMQSGYYEVEFDASTLASGIYFYTLTTEDFVLTKKMVLLK